jgi:hypothetical protein
VVLPFSAITGEKPNQAWSIYFGADQLQDGTRFRALTVVGVYTAGECRDRSKSETERRRFALGTLTSASVSSASVTSPGEALSSRISSGRPPPATNAIHFVPLPSWFYPPAEPPFSPEGAAVQECLFPLQQSFGVECAQQGSPAIEPYILIIPLLQAQPAHGRRRDMCRGETSTPRTSATPARYPPDKPGSMPRDGHGLLRPTANSKLASRGMSHAR